MRPTPIAGLRGLSAYRIPRHPAPIDLPLHGNEGPAPAPELFAELVPELLRRYPSAARLEAVLAERLGIAPARLLVTAGADDALDRAFRAFLAPGDEVVLPSPTFVMLPHYARLVGAVQVTPGWPAEEFPEDAVRASLSDKTRGVALVSPNNPTGCVIAQEVIARLAEAAPWAAMFVDFAYIETADEDPSAAVLRLDNALVFRTLSKVWGLAGLRVGYVAGPESLIAALRAAGPPYPVSAPSLAMALAQLTLGAATMRAYVAAVRDERTRLYQVLARARTQPLRSQANFVFTRLRSERHAVWLRDGLAALGIGIRIFPGEPGIADGARITCPGEAAQLARLEAAIMAVQDPAAWAPVRSIAEIFDARARGRVPIAIVSTGEAGETGGEALLAAGAARVVASHSELEALAEEIA